MNPLEFVHPKPMVAAILAASAISIETAVSWPSPPRPRSLAEVFPGQRTYKAGFDKIPVPAGLASLPAGLSYMYGLRRFTVGAQSDIENEAVLLSVYFQLAPTDWNAYGWTGSAGGGSGWGDNRGLKAALVIGLNLRDLQPGAWRATKSFIPGIESGDYGFSTQNPEPQYLLVQSFPSGAWNDTTPQRLYVPRTFSPAGIRLRTGSTLDVGLIVNGTQIKAASDAAPRLICGFADLSLHVATLNQDIPFSS